MEYNDIKKLIDDMGNSKLSEMNIEFADGTKISLKKTENTNDGTISEETKPIKIENNVNIKNQEKCECEGSIVKSPMVGTFYSKSSPDAEPFVKIGSKVKKGDVLCIIEAMKLMNEIEAECDGEIAEIYVKDEEMVDYGKPLFRII